MEYEQFFYKLQNWWGHLGLTLLGIAYLRIFDLSIFVYLGIAYCMLLSGHLLDDKKSLTSKAWYGTFMLLALFLYMPSFIAMILLGLMYLAYDIVKKHPISAFYRGFGYSLLFWIPFRTFDIGAIPLFLLIAGIASISELTHEAEHFEQDISERRFTTAHALGMKLSHQSRMAVKTFVMLIGMIMLVMLSIRN